MGLFDWIDNRTGYRKLLKSALYEHVPGGSRWRYIWGSTLSFAIVVQFITGVFLWMHYSPSAQSAWESVYYINEVMPGGWLLRGIHHYMAQLMVPLLVLHFMQVIIDGAYKAPREFNYWFGLGLLVLVLAISLTGYLLPWDQRGYWSTKVVTNLVGNVPVVGDAMQRTVVGDANYGHHTLTRFFALHAGVLPALLVMLIIAHIALFRKHGLTPKLPKKKRDGMFFPDQVLMDAVACCVVMLAVLGLVWYFKGAALGAPANPAEQYSAARPDWYFMFLFQFLKLKPFAPDGPFGENGLIVASLIIPGLVFGLLMLMPLIGRWKIGHVFNLFTMFAGLAGFGYLTYVAFSKDAGDPHFKAAVAQANKDSARAIALAKKRDGIPTEGALALLRDDPLTQGPRLFKSQCASCHAWDGHNGLGEIIPDKDRSAPDLARFASREWLAGFLDPKQIETHKYFSGTRFVSPPPDDATKEKMAEIRKLLKPDVIPDAEPALLALATTPKPEQAKRDGWIATLTAAALPDNQDRITSLAGRLSAQAVAPKKSKMVRIILDDIPDYTAEQKDQLNKIIAALSAEAKLPLQKEIDAKDTALIEEGRKLLSDVALDCTDCHQWRANEGGSGPTFEGYGSTEWLREFLKNPAHDNFYGKRNDRMPAFGEGSRLSARELDLLIRWMRGEE
jgi:ubiquinol-cytochrome c reductase cytochrome b subunit